MSTALPVSASRVAVPDRAGRVDPLEWLPPDRARVVANLETLRKEPHEWEDIHVACHRVPESEEAELAEKLLSTGIVLVKEQDLPRDGSGQLMQGGLFSVSKNGAEDRLIFAPREFDQVQCSREEGPEPHGHDPEFPHRLAFRVLGMGDRNGCAIVQATHEAILQARALLESDAKIVCGEPSPVQDTWQGVYLDDLLITHRLSLETALLLHGSFVPPAPKPEDPDMKLTGLAGGIYEKAGLERAVRKSFRGMYHFKAWRRGQSGGSAADEAAVVVFGGHDCRDGLGFKECVAKGVWLRGVRPAVPERAVCLVAQDRMDPHRWRRLPGHIPPYPGKLAREAHGVSFGYGCYPTSSGGAVRLEAP